MSIKKGSGVGDRKQKRYRYISSGVAIGSEQIKFFRLIGGKNVKVSYSGKAVFRVNILNDLILEKWPNDSYYTTKDERTIEDLGYYILIWNEKKSRWIIHNEYKGAKICDIPLL